MRLVGGKKIFGNVHKDLNDSQRENIFYKMTY